MTKTMKGLAGLLVLQAALAVGMNLNARDLAPPAAGGPWLDLDTAAIDRLRIEAAAEQPVELVRRDGQWIVPAAGDFPADAGRVSQLLDRIAGLRAGSPIATSPSAQARFKVAPDAFERKLVLARGDAAAATLYLGTAQGARRVPARLDGSDRIHEVALPAYDIAARSDDWLDKAIAAVPDAEVEAVELGDLRLTRQPAIPDAAEAVTGTPAASTWQASGLADGETLKPEAATALVRQLASLRIDRVLGAEPPADAVLDPPALAATVVRKDGRRIEYRLAKRGQDDWLMKTSARPEYFALPGWAVTPLLEASRRETLVARGAAPAGPADPAGAGNG